MDNIRICLFVFGVTIVSSVFFDICMDVGYSYAIFKNLHHYKLIEVVKNYVKFILRQFSYSLVQSAHQST